MSKNTVRSKQKRGAEEFEESPLANPFLYVKRIDLRFDEFPDVAYQEDLPAGSGGLIQ